MAVGGLDHSLALKTDGSLWAWGANWEGQLGVDASNRSIPNRVGNENDWDSIWAGERYSLARKMDGTLWGWGGNRFLTLGDTGDISLFRSPAPILSGLNIDQLSAGRQHVIALDGNQQIVAWGSNEYGQLGTGVKPYIVKPHPMISLGSQGAVVEAGWNESSVILDEGSLKNWGDNYFGQSGTGDFSHPTLDPLSPEGPSNWQAIAAGERNKVGLASDGTLWQWGNGLASPSQLNGETDWAHVVAGQSHFLALNNNGSLWAWGGNWIGQLGDGTTDHKQAPVRIGSDSDWMSIGTGWHHSFAIKTDGSLWVWGWNSGSALGLGSSEDLITVPTRLGESQDWLMVIGGYRFSLGLKQDGTLWGWGANGSMQVGEGFNHEILTPTQIGGDSDWIKISAGGDHGLALKSDGTLWGWGRNDVGQLGSDTRGSHVWPPTQIFLMAPEDVTQPGDPLLVSSLNSPEFEEVDNVIDNSPAKWLNQDAGTSTASLPVGFVVTPSVGSTRVTGMRLLSANDFWDRDPATIVLEGSNDETLSSFDEGNWTEIVRLENIAEWPGRFRYQTFSFPNSENYLHYRWTVLETQGPSTCCFQIAEVELLSSGDSDVHWTNLDAGWFHSLGILNDGTVMGWGKNLFGQAGSDSRGLTGSPEVILTDSFVSNRKGLIREIYWGHPRLMWML